jgi:Skp family chaperone for outer membrane proteins
MRFFNYVTLTVAIIISICAAYYSIIGLTAIFAAAFWPIIIMGSVLELGKLTGAVWLHLNWRHAHWWIKAYMVPAVAVLMLITSMGIFGFLSKAHIEQTAGKFDVATQVEQLNLDVSVQQQTIDNNKKLIAQLDAAVDSLIGAATTQGQEKRQQNSREARRAAQEATKLRTAQEPERAKLQSEIVAASNKIAEINKAKLVLEQEVKKLEVEVGPIKYVAELIYGNNPGVDTLEKAVRWMIIILVVVFDPLAVVLILAATSGLQTPVPFSAIPAVMSARKKEEEIPNDSEEEPKKNLTEIQIQEVSLPESSLEPSVSPKKSSATKRAPRKLKSQ